MRLAVLVAASLWPGIVLAAVSRPGMSVTCSRIGQTARAFIEKGVLISAVQTWSSVVDFAPGAEVQR